MYCFEDELSDEVFGVQEISAVTLDDSQLVTLNLESGNYLRFQPNTGAPCNVVPLHLYKKTTKDVDLCNVTPVNTAIISYGGTSTPILGKVHLNLESGNYLRFQPNTGAPCNVVPLHLYKKTTKDVDLCNVTPVNTAIISYGGTSTPILGKVHLYVWRGHFRCLLDCNLVDSKKVRPILGRKVCLGMNIIQYLDNDQLNRPQEFDGEAYTHNVLASSPVSADQLIKSFPRVFANGIGALAGEYHMVLNESARPVQHPPPRVPAGAICERLRETLEDLEKHEIIA